MRDNHRERERLDQLLVRRGLALSREQAKRLILAGEVMLGSEVRDKPGALVSPEADITVRERPRYVSRGGQKLEGALHAFDVSPEGKVCLDAGSSTGGFTDCLLQHGALKVYAFDVGTNQLAWKIRSDPRVISQEKFNLRHLKPQDLPEKVDLVVMDLSFISLTLVIPPCLGVVRDGGEVICLIKPQFELAREDIGKGGIVRDPALREKALKKIQDWVATFRSLAWLGHTDSPIQGTDGNHEYLAWLKVLSA